MKKHLAQLLEQAVQRLQEDGTLPAEASVDIQIERTRDKSHGDFAANTAMLLTKQAKRPPRQIAEQLVAALPESDKVVRVDIAGPGFINFFIDPKAGFSVVQDILDAGEDYGRSTIGAGQRLLVEFVSANPTGPLHVGHGRGAAFGGALCSLLSAAGYDVHREYYVNDAGRQMDILATSIWLRYLEALGEAIRFPDNGYRGEYVKDIAAELQRKEGERFRIAAEKVMAELPADAEQGGDKEAHIDALILRAQELLGAGYRDIHTAGTEAILADIRDDLHEFGVGYDEWFSERSLTESGAVERALARLESSGHVYEKDGALWFRSSDFGDEKDRVVRRDNGQITYFASDIAYHLNKLERGFDLAIDVWGADHHGYVPRVKAALQAFEHNPEQLEVRLVQFAILYRGSERMQMSTRSGKFVTLRELRDEVGKDAARFFYVMRRPEQHLDFDLELAKSQSSDNPVYYLQYAHARICSVYRQLAEKGLAHDPARGAQAIERLTEDHEQMLLTALARYPEVIETAAQAHEPHQLAHYLREVANAFHTYYNAHTFIVDDEALRNARLNLIAATRQVLANGLAILGVSAPEAM
ncbi:arginine--tRNA ligase [Alkalilimnicola ehrlichii]|uniref:arginine--tRNA ligase n=1 Tax=Alkalilimnicola ehrlichii TaxID=351052 RepID=UPI000E2E8FC5|nr:arginine--tRNA ligase [Alkalilimnicola ehrlichii]RFA31105.1 arginine--tRNA ligase [Alkalilimnicola ehrlichii]